jgi:hypothetical protein
LLVPQLALPMVIAAIHIALVAHHYHVGSFDDDSAYLLGARGLLHGAGLTGTVTGGRRLIGYYPPGYSALIAPLVAVFGSHYAAVRALSAACAVAVLPLTWWWLGRHCVPPWTRAAVLLLLALDPVLATFGSMVMAETPFLVVLLGWLVLVERWEASRRPLGADAVAVVAAGAALIWLKEAGVGLVAGLALWHLVRRRWTPFLAVAAGTFLLLSPVIAARLAVGLPVAGARYSSELGTYYHGGVLSHLPTSVPHGLHLLVANALPLTLLPSGVPPLPVVGWVADVWHWWSWSVPVLCVVGAAVWARRHGSWLVVVIAVYLAEVVAYPFVNERRIILILPIVAAWYVVGGRWLLDVVASGVTVGRASPGLVAKAVVALMLAALVAVPQSWQLGRDYLFAGNQSSSEPLGSRYMQLLARLGPPSTVVESSYASTTALATGHRTGLTAFQDATDPFTGLPRSCSVSTERQALAGDGAGFLLTGNLNKPYLLDSPCLYRLARSSSWAVTLMHSSADNATVFELLGPGTGHPGLASLLPGAALLRSGGPVTSWGWSSPRVSLLEPGGGWKAVASAGGRVGPGGRAPFLAWQARRPVVASAVRVVVAGGAAPDLGAVSVLGPG